MLGFDLLVVFICVKVSCKINSGFWVEEKRMGREKEKFLEIQSSPNVKSYMYASLVQFCISHLWAMRYVLSNSCVPSTVLYMSRFKWYVVTHESVILPPDSERYSWHLTFPRDPQKRSMPQRWGKGFWELFDRLFDLELCRAFKVVLKHKNVQIVMWVTALDPHVHLY